MVVVQSLRRHSRQHRHLYRRIKRERELQQESRHGAERRRCVRLHRVAHDRAGLMLTAEDGAEFIGRLQRTDDGQRASYLVTLEADENARPQMESAERIFGTEAEALAWLDEQSARRGFARYPMVRE